MEYKNPAPTTNIIVEHENKILLLKRNTEPYLGKFALPGGFVDYDEQVEVAAVREVKEETGVDIEVIEILGVYSAPDRNPSKHTISTVFIAKPLNVNLISSEEGEPVWMLIDEVIKTGLCFDHDKILNDYLQWKETKKTFWSSKNE
ncbi:NUDIX hydrolase [Candidatus Woesearchaeota archaeon]|jgi:8-oxo-dGTP diphosphatase|nr:NUDIX hydrolase [Candidatus Woesearchaeota archaeon]